MNNKLFIALLLLFIVFEVVYQVRNNVKLVSLKGGTDIWSAELYTTNHQKMNSD